MCKPLSVDENARANPAVSVPSLLFLAAALVSFACLSYAGQKATPESADKLDTLALVKGSPITSADFQNRFELSVYPGKDDPTMLEKIKRDFLYSMIAEKLLSEAAAKSDVPYTSSEELVKKEMEDIFMRDALYRKEVVPRATVTSEEILHGFKISIYKYLVDAFYFDGDSTTAWSFYYALQGKKAPDIYQLARSLSVRHDTLEIPYGESTVDIENAFFGHKGGFVSKPTVTVDGLVVFKVLSRELNSSFTAGATPDRWEKIRQILVSRKEEKLGNLYVEEVMRNIEVRVNYRLFRPLVYEIQKLFEKQRPLASDPEYRLYPPDLLHLAERFSADLNEPFLVFSGGVITLGRVFQQLPTAMFDVNDTTLPAITYALHLSLRFISQNHFLVQRARELGLQNDPEVKYNVGMVLDAFRSYRMAHDITDTVKVNQAEVDKFFAAHHDEVLRGVKLKLRLFEANNINEAIGIYGKLSDEKGRPVDPNDTTARWVNAFNLGEMGAVLSELKRGDVYGPVEEDGKFYIYQMLDKRSTVNDAAIKNSIEVAKQMLLEREKSEAVAKYVADLAEKDNVKIFRRNVLSLKVTPFQMLTYRFIGFGGKILAVPALYPRESWIKYYREEQKPPQP